MSTSSQGSSRAWAPSTTSIRAKKGTDYTGLHHFGILVEDVDASSKRVEAHGGQHYMDQADQERVGGFEVKMYGPEGVLFDIAEHPWTGSEPLPVEAKAAAE